MLKGAILCTYKKDTTETMEGKLLCIYMNTITRYKSGVTYTDPISVQTEAFCKKVNNGKDNIKLKDSAKRKSLMLSLNQKVQNKVCNDIDKAAFLSKKAKNKAIYKELHKRKKTIINK